MGNKCISVEAKNFENKLKEFGITYNQFIALRTMHCELTEAGRAEVNDMLKTYESEE